MRGLVVGVVLGLVVAFAVGAGVGLPIAALSGIVGGAGWWITRGHIEEFEQQLRAPGRR